MALKKFIKLKVGFNFQHSLLKLDHNFENYSYIFDSSKKIICADLGLQLDQDQLQQPQVCLVAL